MKFSFLLAFMAIAISTSYCQSDTIPVTGGQTFVSLNDTDLATAGLTITSFSPEVIMTPGDDIALPINARDAAVRPTTFTYAPTTFSPFSGTIGHSGSIFFNSNILGNFEIGDFTIAHDTTRIDSTRNGFFVRSNAGQILDLFDFSDESSTLFTATASELSVSSSLLISEELAEFLGNPAFAGANVGTIEVRAAAVPEPGTTGVAAVFGMISLLHRRRKSVA